MYFPHPYLLLSTSFVRYKDLVNSMSEEGESCMMLAAIENSYDMVKLLVESGGDVNEKAVGENVSELYLEF